MEAQPTPPPPDSVDSSPRASWDEPSPPPPPGSAKLRLMCSYGGHIVPRPHDKSLCYVGGDTRIVVVPRQTSLSDLSTRLSRSFLHARPFVLKYQLPSEDLDSLVSVTTDEDLENMIDEYDHRTTENSSTNNNNNNNSNSNSNSNRPSRIRLFLFPAQPDGPLGLGSAKSEEWLSGSLDGGLSESASVNCLLGLDDEVVVAAVNSGGNNGKVFKEVSDSPMLESNSSFGSASSVPNLPPIKVHVEDQKGVGIIEEQFAQLGVGQKQEEGGFVAVTTATVTEFAANRIVSDDERSDHGVPVGYRKPPTPPPQSQPQPPQFQQKSAGVVDLPSPDSRSSDSSLSNAMSRPKPAIYQDQVQIQSGNSQVPSNTSVDPKLIVTDQQGWIQMQQHVQEPGYVLQPQQPLPQQHQTQQPQQHQTQQPQQQHRPQQYMHSTHLIHHTPAGPVPIPAAYYPVYQQQLHPQHHHHLDQQYPVYYMQSGQAQPYNLSAQPVNVAESAATIPSSQSQNQPNSAAYNPTRNPNSEMAAGAYRTAPATPQLVQVPSSKHQQQYVAYSQIHHHHPQSVPPNSAVPANYAYNYADPAHAQVFYTQTLAPSIPSQYQTMMRPEVSAQLPSDSMKQQVRTSQPL